MRLSQLNGNLVVQFADYITGKPFLSFIGKNKPDETVQALLDSFVKMNMEPILKFIPEETALLLNCKKFLIVEDRNGFDYIYNTSEHRSFSGGNYARKRNEVSSILKSHPKINALSIDVYDPLMHKTMLALYKQWADSKLADHKAFERHEEKAFNRLLHLAANRQEDHLLGLGVFHDSELLAFCIYELTDSEYAVGHTAKSNVAIKGTNAFLMKSLSDSLFSLGKAYFNYEQDLGLDNLRIAKERYRPTFFLKKYIVTAL